jgi:hypothetical protein
MWYTLAIRLTLGLVVVGQTFWLIRDFIRRRPRAMTREEIVHELDELRRELND